MDRYRFPQQCMWDSMPYAKREVTGMIDFSPLWVTMKKKNITQYQLIKNGIDNKTLDSLRKNKNITLATLESLCRILNCTPNDVVRFIDEPEQGNNPKIRNTVSKSFSVSLFWRTGGWRYFPIWLLPGKNKISPTRLAHQSVTSYKAMFLPGGALYFLQLFSRIM